MAFGIGQLGSRPVRRKIAVKVADIFGNDALTSVEVSI